MNENRNKYIILLCLLIMLLVIFSFFSINIIYINYKELNYKESLSIKIGDSLPSIRDYIDAENLNKLDVDDIKWENLNITDNKVYDAGEYNGYINFRNEKSKV